jgi:ribosome biogenesis protein MAK21
VQESPIHRSTHLDQLLAMAGKQSRRESMPVLLALQDLFLSDLLPDRKLRFFRENALRQPPDAEQEALFQFEHTLKLAYASYIKALSSALHDPVVHIRQEAIRITHALLKSKPEQEQALLFVLVNKLGDAERKVASSVCHVLHKLLMTHPAMTEVVAKEVMRLLFDAKTSSRARYYGLVFLSQIVLTKSHRDVAVQLVECYAKIFKMQHVSPKPPSSASSKTSKNKAAAASTDDKDCGKKVLPVVLAGINRALPFASASGGGSRSTAAVEALMESLFETVEASLGSFSAATQALLVLQQLLPGASSSTCSRFYSALYVMQASPSILISALTAPPPAATRASLAPSCGMPQSPPCSSTACTRRSRTTATPREPLHS